MSAAAQYVYEWYGGFKQSQLYVALPRWNYTGGAEGGYFVFNFVAGSYNFGQVSGIGAAAVMNFQPNDGTGTYLQSGPGTGAIPYYFTSFGTANAGYTPIADSDGHNYQQNFDSAGRPTIHYQWSGSQWLATVEQWDDHNNRIADVDMLGNRTDYAYDANGNMIAMAQPAPVPGAFRPTSLYSYDVDPNGAGWQVNPNNIPAAGAKG